MAKFIPSIEEVINGRVKPQAGELDALYKLQNLDDSYEVYFNPMLNGDFPDIVVFRHGYGVFIIEVKDWDLRSYIVENDNDKLTFNLENQTHQYEIKNPLDQANSYKSNIMNLYSQELLHAKILYDLDAMTKKHFINIHVKTLGNPYELINTAVYFYKHDKNYLYNKIKNREEILGNDSDICAVVKSKLSTKNENFDNIFDDLKNIINTSLDFVEQRQIVSLDKEQERLASISYPEQKKIKGIAGSGKSLVMAQKAINAYKATGEAVLIICYNITLLSKIRDNISQQLGSKVENRFIIKHFHGLVGSISKDYDIKVSHINKYSKSNNDLDMLLENDQKYKTILIDEGQDFQYEWFEFIKNNLLAQGGSYTIFCDAAQNIYERDQDAKECKTNIIGRWNELKKYYRSSEFLYDFCADFNNTNLISQDSEEMRREPMLNFGDDIYLSKDCTTQNIVKILNFIRSTYKMSINDITIIASKIKTLQTIDYEIRVSKGFKTITTFETQEMSDIMASITNQINNKKDIDNIKLNTYNIRRAKKFAFRLNSGKLKISTIHSFKGMQSRAIILILGEDEPNQKLIYTAISRAKDVLYIISENSNFNQFYDKHFEKINSPYK